MSTNNVEIREDTHVSRMVMSENVSTHRLLQTQQNINLSSDDFVNYKIDQAQVLKILTARPKGKDMMMKYILYIVLHLKVNSMTMITFHLPTFKRSFHLSLKIGTSYS